MRCIVDKKREVEYPCFKGCPLFGDCVMEFEREVQEKTVIEAHRAQEAQNETSK